MESKVYKESQGFGVWIYVLVLGLLGVDLCQGFHKMNFDGGYSIGFSFGVGTWILLGLIVLLLLLRLRTTIDQEGIEITFIPFVWKKRWRWEEMDQVYLRKYSIMDYGGWGYRISGQGIAYNTKGNIGIQLLLKNGKKILIGAQKSEEIQQLIQRYHPNDEAIID